MVLNQINKYITYQLEEMEENPSNPMFPKIHKSQSFKKKDNPFAMPEDAQIFRMKEKQKQKKRQEKLQRDKMKIWEKGIKNQCLTIKQLNELADKDGNEEQNQTKMSLIEAAKNAIKNRVKINEPMHEFITKKRQTLLFQMLIDHKRQKINEFQDLTRLHRKGLERAQKMLQEDMQSFNSYLNENKKQARQAIKKAQQQTREKNEKVAIIKEKLQVQADLTGKNMSKRQTLQNLRKYKLFLDSLNPELSEEERKKFLQKIEKEEQQSQNFGSVNTSENFDDSEEEDSMFFKEPNQLMDIFHSLQESNLSLITHLKEMEQEIQEARGLLNSKKQVLTKKKDQLLTIKQQINNQINQVDDEIFQLKRTTNKDEISVHFQLIEEEVIKLAKQYGFASVNQKHLTAQKLLTEVEHRIQKQLQFLIKANKEDSKTVTAVAINRRNENKQKNNTKNNELQMKGVKEKVEMSPQKEKRKGRPIMARSLLKKEEKKKEVEVEEPEQEIEKRKYLMQ